MAKPINWIAPVDDNDEQPPESAWGEERTLRESVLHVDRESYQRPLNQERVRAMAAHFDKRLFGRLVVNQRANDHFFIVDGQHRFTAAKLKGMVLIPCIVFYGLSQEEEADLFARWNSGQRRTSPFQNHHARGAAMHPGAQQIDSILAEFGCVLVEKATSSKWGHIAAVHTVYDIYGSRAGGPAMLRTVLRVVTNGWMDQKEGLQEDTLRGVYGFIRRYGKEPQYSETHLVKTLSRNQAKHVLAEAKHRANANREKVHTGVVAELLACYDKGRKRGAKLGKADEDED